MRAIDTFDKSTYLNLNQEYNWNNPQSYIKKDNQATTLLKEVGGTVRNALGSTDSDNVGELGNKIQNQLESQAISTTEDLINDKANQFFNQFGSGRSEIRIHGFNSKALDYSLKTIQPLSKLNDNSKDLTFFQGQVTSGDNQGNRRSTINLGIGHRLLVDDDRAIAGINLFHDYETRSAHKRLSLGLEYQRTNFHANVNAYHARSDNKTSSEAARSGYDIRLTGQAPYLPWATIKGTHYYWDKTDAKSSRNIKGNVLGIEVKLTPSISFEFGQQYNNKSSESYGKLNVKLPFDDNQPLTNFAIADTAFKASSQMDLGALDWVERDNKIQVDGVGSHVFTGGLFNGVTYGLVISPDTGRVWLDRNLGATQVCTDVDGDGIAGAGDEACYGDLYQWGKNNDGHEDRTNTNTSATLASSITNAGTNLFIKNYSSIGDWASVDSTGALRTAAWADGGANDICPIGFGVPTTAELEADTTQATTTNIIDRVTAFSSFLKLPLAGIRYPYDGLLYRAGEAAFLWSRSAFGVDSGSLNISSAATIFNDTDRIYSLGVRCIKG